MKKSIKKRHKLSLLVLSLAIISVIFAGAAYALNTVAPVRSPINASSEQKDASPIKPTESWPAITPEKLLTEVNERRANEGVAPLELDTRLNDSAQIKCDDMARDQYFGHVNPNTNRQGYTIATEKMQNLPGAYSENLVRVFPQDNESVIFDNWFSSEQHRKAALDSRYTKTGFGVCGLRQIVQHFYSPQIINP